MTIRVILLFATIYLFRGIAAQEYSVKGKVIDSVTREALPFAIVGYNEDSHCSVTDIDGFFTIHSNLPVTKISLRYPDYQTVNVDMLSVSPDSVLVVQMVPLTSLPGTEVLQNPVKRIINLVRQYRDRNNPQKTVSFSYSSYNKMYFGLKEDSLLRNKKQSADSIPKKHTNENLLLKNHFFLLEFATRRFFKQPDKDHEEIISSKASGFSDPFFAFLGTQMQSFEFYGDLVTMMDQKYLNPLSKAGDKKYFFFLQSTYLTETLDTLFVVGFKPKKNFNGLEGFLYINSNGYAVQNAIAQPAQETRNFSMKIYQSYDLINDRQWFPHQLKIDLFFRNMKLKNLTKSLYPIAVGKTYIRDVNLNPDFSNVRFNEVGVRVAEDASTKQDSVWQNYRPMPVSPLDSGTYRIVDSLSKAKDMEKKLKKIDAVVSGFVPFWVFNIDYKRYLSYNRFEGVRVGAGLMTNEKVASFFSLGGYFAYGLHDKKWKYSPSLMLFPDWQSETKLTLKYTHDVMETGQYSFFEDRLLNSSEWLRDFWVSQMNEVDEKEISLSFRTLKYLKLNLFLNESFKETADYAFQLRSGGFRFTEVGLSLRFAYKEKFILTPAKRRISLGTSYPMLWVNVRKGLDLWGGQFTYQKYEFKVSNDFISRFGGETKITLVAGKVIGDIPATNLYYGRGSFQRFTIEAENSFETMRFNEFLSSEFVSAFAKQNFGSLWFHSPYFHPDFCLATNVGIGRLRNPASHNLPGIKTLDRGYYESGFLIDKILNQPFLSLGVGAFYRYGPYAFRKISDNIAYKLTLKLSL